MKAKRIECPNCMATIEYDPNKRIGYCQYCGEKLYIDDGVKRTEHTYRKIDEARIRESDNMTEYNLQKMKTEVEESKRSDRAIYVMLVFVVLLWVAIIWYWDKPDREAAKKKEQGLISAGSYSDYEDKNYETVVEQLKAKGFTNIKTIDLDDSFMFVRKEDTVESISIAGDSQFDSYDYFEPDDKVIISYH